MTIIRTGISVMGKIRKNSSGGKDKNQLWRRT